MYLQFHHSTAFIFFFIIILTTISCCNCFQEPNYTDHFCFDSEVASPSYRSDIVNLLDNLSSAASVNSFYNDTVNEVYGIFLCRGDISNESCQNCIETASKTIPQDCREFEKAIIWYDICMLRYSNYSFFGEQRADLSGIRYNSKNISSPNDNDPSGLEQLIDGLIDTVPDSARMFGYSSDTNRYAMAQCTRDINSMDCRLCLQTLKNDSYSECCKGKIGWQIYSPSCSIRYENYSFINLPALSPSPSPSSLNSTLPQDSAPNNDENAKKGNNTIIIVVAAIGVSLSAIVAALLGFWCYNKRRKSKKGMTQEIPVQHSRKPDKKDFWDPENINETDDEESHHELCFFDLATINAATNSFSISNKLGEGGFGPVYKGELASGGTKIAVKRLSLRSKQGLKEFSNEVKLIAKLQHKNLVRLLGYCLEGDEKLLVYEYMANTSLDAFLFDPVKSMGLNWQQRANIVMGTARGLLYLHEDSRLKVIHRDMKASNVLLDDEMNPKISDFGTARIFGGKQIEANTERVVGSYGYMAPEYALEGQFSVKSDVYSFGVLMLETITGEHNRTSNGQSLVAYAWKLWSEEKASELIDSKIEESCPKREVLQWIHIALLCIQDNPACRPTMSEVVQMLGSKSLNLPQPTTPPYTVDKLISFSGWSSVSSTGTGTRTRTGTGSLTTDKSTSEF